jgi:SAM-dependent methyltransferase
MWRRPRRPTTMFDLPGPRAFRSRTLLTHLRVKSCCHPTLASVCCRRLTSRRSLSSVSERGDRWTSMESANDLDWFVHFLDRTLTRPGEHHPAVALLELDPGQRCLDVGCGVGEDARSIAELCSTRVVGVDVNTRTVRESRSRSAGRDGLEASCRSPARRSTRPGSNAH